MTDDIPGTEKIRRRVNVKQSSKAVWQKDITIEIENAKGTIIYNSSEDLGDNKHDSDFKTQIKNELAQCNQAANEMIKEAGGKLAEDEQ